MTQKKKQRRFGEMRVRHLILCGAALFAGLSSFSAQAQDNPFLNFGLYGNPGLIDMPSADMAPDGQISLSHNRFGPTRRTSLAFQITPRLSGTFSYSGTKDLSDLFDVYWDRSFDVSYLLLKEGDIRPAIAFGMRDFLGTGLQGSEYFVASKSFGDKLRLTGGLGWGRLGTAGQTGLSFGDRTGETLVTGGTLNVDQWFHGPIGAFGGVSYIASDKLRLMAEYSSDAYVEETERGIVDRKSDINFGLSYHLSDSFDLNAYYLYGDMIGFGITGYLNPKTPKISGGIETAPLPVKRRPSRSADALGWSGAWAADSSNATGIRNALYKALKKEGIELEAMSLTATRAELVFENKRYPARAQAIGRVARFATHALPPSVEQLIITEVVKGVPTTSTVMSRSDLERLEFEPAGAMLQRTQFVDSKAIDHDDLVAVEQLYPELTWSLTPNLSTSFFDPEEPIRADFGLRASGTYAVRPGFFLNGAAVLKLTGNLSDEDGESESSDGLPAVRTNRAFYADRVQLKRLTADWYARPAENIYSRLSFGYLERMYAGVSGELLWKKTENPYALGLELNYAVQRDSSSVLGLGDYNIVTGHASGYMDFGNGFHGQLDVGRYLAGDWGATVSLDREFNNGWRVGAYATFTDVPFEEFGEGSFDKGIRISVPLDWFIGTPTQYARNFELQSLSRDGGARLDVSGRLYEEIRATHASELQGRWGRFWR